MCTTWPWDGSRLKKLFDHGSPALTTVSTEHTAHIAARHSFIAVGYGTHWDHSQNIISSDSKTWNPFFLYTFGTALRSSQKIDSGGQLGTPAWTRASVSHSLKKVFSIAEHLQNIDYGGQFRLWRLFAKQKRRRDWTTAATVNVYFEASVVADDLMSSNFENVYELGRPDCLHILKPTWTWRPTCCRFWNWV